MPMQNQEIRLIQLHPGIDPADLRCDIIHVSLNHKPSYEALSYTWGDPTSRQAITCNLWRDTLLVTLNCASALRRLRLGNVERILWIDAICIDQENIQERNEQVQLMRDMYQGALRVLVCLGEESADSARAIDFVLDDYSTSGETANRPPIGLGQGVFSSPQQVALDGLLNRPWF